VKELTRPFWPFVSLLALPELTIPSAPSLVFADYKSTARGRMNMRASLTTFLLLSAYVLSPALASAQIVIDNIDDFPGAANILNCTSTKQNVAPPGWEWNCDPGAGNCSSTSTSICGKSSLESTITRDGQAREMDVSWNYSTGVTHGGMNFHAAINSATNGNLDATDTHFSWGGWFYYTALDDGTNWSINQLEFDLNQVLDDGGGLTAVIIYAAQCDFTYNGGTWEFANLWPLHSNIKCGPRDTVWTPNTWHHVVISAHRCATYVKGSGNCTVTYDSVAFDNDVPTKCTSNCTHNGANQIRPSWTPIGLLLQNVQLNPDFAVSAGMTAYADLMTTNSPEATQVATPGFVVTVGLGVTTVAITDATPGATICYTTDGTLPTANGGGECTHGTTYTQAFTVSSGEIVSAIGSKDGIDFDSSVATETF
jgi:Fn3 associated